MSVVRCIHVLYGVLYTVIVASWWSDLQWRPLKVRRGYFRIRVAVWPFIRAATLYSSSWLLIRVAAACSAMNATMALT